jgi:hypothetical protein
MTEVPDAGSFAYRTSFVDNGTRVGGVFHEWFMGD